MERCDNNENMSICSGFGSSNFNGDIGEQMEGELATSSNFTVVNGDIDRQHIDDGEKQNEIEELLSKDNDKVGQALYSSFQSTATSVAQLFTECCNGTPEGAWTNFQSTSNSVTKLYHDGMDAYKYGINFGTQCGYQRRSKELVNWLKKKRRLVLRDEIIGFLTGTLPPSRPECASVSDVGSMTNLTRSTTLATSPPTSHRRRMTPSSQVDTVLDNDESSSSSSAHSGKKRSVSYGDYYMDCPTPTQKRYRLEFD